MSLFAQLGNKIASVIDYRNLKQDFPDVFPDTVRNSSISKKDATSILAAIRAAAAHKALGHSRVYLGGARHDDIIQRTMDNPKIIDLTKEQVASDPIFKEIAKRHKTDASDSYNFYTSDVYLPSRNPGSLMHELGHAVDLNEFDENIPERKEIGNAYRAFAPTLWKEHAAWSKGRDRLLRGAAATKMNKNILINTLEQADRIKPIGLGSYWGGSIGSLGGGLAGLVGANALLRHNQITNPLLSVGGHFLGASLGGFLGGDLGSNIGLGIGRVISDIKNPDDEIAKKDRLNKYTEEFARVNNLPMVKAKALLQKTSFCVPEELGKQAASAIMDEEDEDLETTRKPSRPGFLLPGLGLAALGLGGAYGMGSDAHAKTVSEALAKHNTPLQPGETELTRYAEMLSPAASSTPFGMNSGSLLSAARSSPAFMKATGQDVRATISNMTALQEAKAHYDQFSKGPAAAVQHLTHPGFWLKDEPGTIKAKGWFGKDKTVPYAKAIKPYFEKAWKDFVAKELPGTNWLSPHEVNMSAIPYEKQMQFLRDFGKSLPPEIQQMRNQVESSPKLKQIFENNLKGYLPAAQGALKVRQALKTTGLTAGGATLGGTLGHYLHNLMRGDDEDEGYSLPYLASTLGGAGLGGYLGYLASKRGA